MVWIWGPSCAIVAVILLLGCYEIVLGPGYIVRVEPELESLQKYRNDTAERVFIFLVDGLRNLSGLTAPNGSSYGLVKLCLSFSRTTMVALASGRHDPITSTLLGSPSLSDNIFYYTDRNYFFGPDTTPNYFKNSQDWVTETYPLKWLNNFPEFLGQTTKPDQYIVDKIIKVIKERKPEKKKFREIFLIQLVTINLAVKAEGVKSTRAAEAVLSIETYVAKVQKNVEQYYQDNKTAYVIISGHGTDIYGRSGGSSEEELHVPLYVWGAGSGKGGLQIARRQIIDLCPLLAGLIGIPVPSHSRGRLPKNYVSSEILPEALTANSLQLATLCRAISRSAGPLTRRLVSTSLTPCLFDDYAFNLTTHLDKKNLETATSEATSFIEIAHTCIGKLEGFYSGSLFFTMAMSYLAWIGLLCSCLAPSPPPTALARNWIPLLITVTTHFLFVMKIVIVAIIIWIEAWPWYLLPVFELPVILWWTAVSRSERLWLTFCQEGVVRSGILVFSALAIVEIVYWTDYRLYFALLFLLPYAAWMSSMNSRFVPMHVPCVCIGTSVILIVLPSLMAQFNESGKPSPAILNVGAVIWIIGGCLCAYRMDLRAREHIVTAFLAATGTLTIWVIDLYHLGVWDYWMRGFSWTLLPSPLITAFGSSSLSTRLMQVALGLSVPLLLVSIGQEPLCYLFLSVNLYTWLRLEASSPQYQNQQYLRMLALHFYLNYAIFIIGPQPIIFTYAHKILPLFVAEENTWLSIGLTWCRLTLAASLIAAFWSAASLYIGTKTSLPFKCWLVLGALTAARQCFALVITDDPNLSSLLLSHLIFFVIIIPFTLIPLVLLVTKFKFTQE